jgi:hypothetical protein
VRVRAIDIAGALALVGVAVLVVLSFTYRPQATTTTVSTGDSILSSPSATAAPKATATSTPTPTPTATPTPTEAPAEPEPSVELVPEEERSSISVQVVNGGAPDGSAGEMTARLAAAAFSPLEGSNAVQPVGATTIWYRDGQQSQAATVNSVVGAEDDDVRVADAADANWSALGEGLDVLVVLGPGLP